MQRNKGSDVNRPQSTPSLNFFQTTTSDPQLQRSPSKRKRSQAEQSATSWFGMAFQIPAVIKREISDFVRTVKEGSPHSPELRRSKRNSIHPPRASTERHKRNLSNHPATQFRSHPSRTQTENTLSSATPFEHDPEAPSPKKLRIDTKASESIGADRLHECCLTPLPVVESISSFGSMGFTPTQASPMSGNPAENPSMRLSRVIDEGQIEDADMEEISTSGAHPGASFNSERSLGPAGSNSVLFPDGRAYKHRDSPNSALGNSESSVSTWKPFSSASTSTGSLLHQRQSSTNTSLTSLNSAISVGGVDKDQTAHPVRLTSVGSNAAPRIRHTKLLGTPRASSGTNSLGTSSFTSQGFFGASSACGSPHTSQARSIVRGSASLSNLSLPHSQSWKQQEGDSECQANNRSERKKLASNQGLLGSQASSASRPKVPLSEIVGRSSMSQLRNDSFSNSSQGPSKLTVSGALTQNQSSSLAHTVSISSKTKEDVCDEGRLLRAEGESAEDSSSFSVTNTSSSLNTLRSQASDAIIIRSNSRPHTPNEFQSAESPNNVKPSSQPLPLQDAIVEVDEDDDDGSFEFLEREEALSISPQGFTRKRKRKIRYGELVPFRRQGLAAIEQSSSKLIDLLPHQSKAKQPRRRVLEKLGLSRSTNIVPERASSASDTQSSWHDVGNDTGDSDHVTPTKKIRILESEIARLKQELESERVKKNIESMRSSRSRKPFSLSINSPDRRSSMPRVKFSPSCSLPSSGYPPNSSGTSGHRAHAQRAKSPPTTYASVPTSPTPRSRKIISSSQAHNAAEPDVIMSDSPVVVRKPSEGVMVGGSPFIVSRVYGTGPEVAGERTPALAEKWLQKHKSNSNSQRGMRAPGLAQDLFGAKSLKGRPNSFSGLLTTFDQSHSKRVSGPIRHGKRESSIIQSGTDSGASASETSSGWNRDRELDSDLFGAVKKPLRRSSLIPTTTPIHAPGATVPLSPSKIKNVFRNSMRTHKSIPSEGGVSKSIHLEKGKTKEPSSEPQMPDMATFLNELKSAGRERLRKTMGSIKYYNAPHSSEHTKTTPLSSFPRPANPKDAEILRIALERQFGQSSGPSRESRTSRRSIAMSNTGTSSSTNTSNSNRRSSFRPVTPVLDSLPGKADSENSTEIAKSPLSQRVYPSCAPKENQDENIPTAKEVHVVLGEAISTPKSKTPHLSRSLVDHSRTPRARNIQPTVVDPASPIQKDFTMDELIEQVSSMRQANEALANSQPDVPIRTRQESFLRKCELVQEMGLSSSAENSFEQSPSSFSAIPNDYLHNLPGTTPAKQIPNPRKSLDGEARPRSSPILKNLNQNRPRSIKSPTKSRLEPSEHTLGQEPSIVGGKDSVRLISILNSSSLQEADKSCDSGTNQTSDSPSSRDTSFTRSKRVVIIDDPNHSRRSSSTIYSKRSSFPSTSQQVEKRVSNFIGAVDDHSFSGVGEKENRPDGIIGYGVQSGQAQSTSGSEWVLVKSDSNRLGDGEPNLKRWSLRASAILSANPKLT